MKQADYTGNVTAELLKYVKISMQTASYSFLFHNPFQVFFDNKKGPGTNFQATLCMYVCMYVYELVLTVCVNIICLYIKNQR